MLPVIDGVLIFSVNEKWKAYKYSSYPSLPPAPCSRKTAPLYASDGCLSFICFFKSVDDILLSSIWRFLVSQLLHILFSCSISASLNCIFTKLGYEKSTRSISGLTKESHFTFSSETVEIFPQTGGIMLCVIWAFQMPDKSSNRKCKALPFNTLHIQIWISTPILLNTS